MEWCVSSISSLWNNNDSSNNVLQSLLEKMTVAQLVRGLSASFKEPKALITKGAVGAQTACYSPGFLWENTSKKRRNYTKY
jgi:hypothetical protein